MVANQSNGSHSDSSQNASKIEGAPGWDWKPVESWYVVGVLFIAYTFSFIDRQILALMVDPIKNDLGLSDTQISLLHGIAFAIFYTILGLPLGRLMDNSRRTYIVSAGIALWSIMTAACGLMRSFWGLFFCRVGVGIGEAALSPGAYSLISDYFPPDKRARAIAIYTLGVTIGAGLAFIFGGLIISVISSKGLVSFPLLGQIAAWQAAFIIVGLPGLLVSGLVLTIREPIRREQIKKADGVTQMSLSDVIKFVSSKRVVFATLFISFGLVAMASYAMLGWLPATLARRFAWTPADIGLAYGLCIAVPGSIGIIASGWYSDVLERRGVEGGAIRILVISAALTMISGMMAPVMPTAALSIGALALFSCFSVVPFGIAPVAIQSITPNQMRGQITALYLFTINILGLGFGPTFAALITDYVFRDEMMVGWSITAVIAITTPCAIFLLLVGKKHYLAAKKGTLDWV